MNGLRDTLQRDPAKSVFFVLSCIVFLALFSWHIKVGLSRYFDVDEFTYFHWVSQFAQRERPYVDFFMFIPPLFLMVFAPVFLFFGNQVSVFLAGRVVAIVISLLLFLSISMLFGLTRKNRSYVLLPAIIAAFLPMPFDKFFEIRPDNLATLFALVGVVCHSLFLSGKKPKLSAFLSGFFYASSLLVFPKTISFVGVAFIIWLFDIVHSWKLQKHIVREGRQSIRSVLDLPHVWMIVGGGVICLLVGVYLLLLGNVSQVVYSLTTLALETNKTYAFVMEPHLFFFPNAGFYGGNGLTLGLILNHFFWVVGIIVGSYRLFSALKTSNGDKRIFLRELLISGIFFVNVWLYISFYPMKHPQYLIPVALFVAFYAADGLAMVFSYVDRFHNIMSIIGIGTIAFFLLAATRQVNEPKLHGSNARQLQQLAALKQSIPLDAYVFDIEGRMVFWKQPYVVCCLPFGEYMYHVSRPPRPLRNVLEEKKVPYLWQGDSRRIYTLEMPDRIYIQENYEMVEGWGDTLWTRK